MREAEFLNQLYRLIVAEVVGLTSDQKIDLIRALCNEAQQTATEKPSTCQVVPFIAGRRPIDEAAHPGLGSSDSTSLILEEAAQGENKSVHSLSRDRVGAVRSGGTQRFCARSDALFCWNRWFTADFANSGVGQASCGAIGL